jgi:hypothetical protein
MSGDDPFDINKLALTDEQVEERLAVVPRKIQKRRRHFIMMPMAWRERLDGATGHTILVALDLIYLGWKSKGAPVKLANGMLRHDGISRHSKWRALNDLERRGLVTVERRSKRSPLVHLLHL